MLKKIKHLFAVLLLVGFAAQPALAESFNQDDMAFAFGNSFVSSDLGDMALLSNQEMMETEGGVGWIRIAVMKYLKLKRKIWWRDWPPHYPYPWPPKKMM